jgi:hypothetical protein
MASLPADLKQYSAESVPLSTTNKVLCPIAKALVALPI